MTRIGRLLAHPAGTLKDWRKRTIDRMVDRLLHMKPVGQWDEGDVFVAGYPKSGNTWFQNLAAACMYGIDPAVTPDSVIQELVPDMHYKRYYRRFSQPMVVKTHDLPRPEYQRVVLLLRDGRDVMVLYYHYLKAIHKTDIDFVELVTESRRVSPCPWPEYISAWLDNPYNAETLTIKYENLLNDPVECLQRFCQFVGMERDPDDLQRIARRAAFYQLQSKERKSGLENWSTDARFFRRGVAGSYRDEMPPEVQDAFMNTAGAALERAGYPASSDSPHTAVA